MVCTQTHLPTQTHMHICFAMCSPQKGHMEAGPDLVWVENSQK